MNGKNYANALRNIWELNDTLPYKVVLAMMMSYVKVESGTTFVSPITIAEQSHLDLKLVTKIIKRLEDDGMIRREKDEYRILLFTPERTEEDEMPRRQMMTLEGTTIRVPAGTIVNGFDANGKRIKKGGDEP